MVKILRLFNTFSRSLKDVYLSGEALCHNKRTPSTGSFYICGPTVYADSHLGHALTYLRADLFRRFVKRYFNTRLHTVINITDIDDKILEKSESLQVPFKKISEMYYNSFLEDMKLLRIIPADLYVKVTSQIKTITTFINKLEKDGHAYIANDGDVCFRISSLKNYQVRQDPRKQDTSVKDFVLWKVAKPNEPTWSYRSAGGNIITGRPGWHVQCSAIATAFFGKNLDFHFGGKDLIFPHHYNEEACCCAFHQLDSSKSIHVWATNWLHSGHLILKDVKMSKSLGNVISIKEFINNSSVNVLRLIGIYSHYRTDIIFDQDLIEKVSIIDHKLNAFISFLIEKLYEAQNGESELDELEIYPTNSDVENAILKTHEDIVEGVCDDLHLDRGLESILSLSKLVYSKDIKNLRTRDVISLLDLMRDWCDVCGLSYHRSMDTLTYEGPLIELLSEFRKSVRSRSLEQLRDQSSSNQDKSLPKKLLEECDNLRSRMDELGFVYRDPKS